MATSAGWGTDQTVSQAALGRGYLLLLLVLSRVLLSARTTLPTRAQIRKPIEQT